MDMSALENCTPNPLEFRADMRREVAVAIQQGNADMLVHAAIVTGAPRVSCYLSTATKQLQRAGLGGRPAVSTATRNSLLLDLLGGSGNVSYA